MTRKQLMLKWKRKRQKIVRMRDKGRLTFAEIARQLQEEGKPLLSRQHIRQLYVDEKARMENSND